ncbi:MAG: hypothetical protein IJA36_05875 [Lachnospiraceae bacterium]|nr:hypothetical protein [Lachnospiraceae bacterium]
MNKQKKGINIIHIIISAFLSTFILEILLSVFLMAGPLNESILERGITESGFIKKSVENFKQDWQQTLKTSELAEDFGVVVVEESLLYSAFINGMEADGMGEQDIQEFQQALETEMKEYLESKGIEKNKKVAQITSQFVSEAATSYKGYIHPVFIKRFYTMKSQVEKQLWLFLGISILCGSISCLFLLKSSQYLHHGIRTVSISFLSAMVCWGAGIGCLYYQFNGWLTSVEPIFYQELLVEYRKYFVQTAVIMAILGIGIFILLQLLIHQMKHRGK